MNLVDANNLIGKHDLILSQAMQVIESNGKRILFVVDDNDKVLGCVTDGDIRRFLLSGGNLSDRIVKVINRNPRLATSEDDAKNLYNLRNYSIIPIIDSSGRIIKFYDGESTTYKRGILNSKVVINAGGKGTRLDPFTRVLPKPLIPVGELPIIELIMKEFQSYSCDDFHIIINYKRDLLKAYFTDNEGKYNISWYEEDMPLGTGGGLSLLRGKIDDTFFFVNCDSLLTADYESILKYHKENKNIVTMVCVNKTINIPYGVVEMGENGVIENMKEKPEISFLTNTGIYVVEPEVIEDIDDNKAIGFPSIVERQRMKDRRVAVFPVSENDWMDMGQLPELEKMRVRMYGE